MLLLVQNNPLPGRTALQFIWKPTSPSHAGRFVSFGSSLLFHRRAKSKHWREGFNSCFSFMKGLLTHSEPLSLVAFLSILRRHDVPAKREPPCFLQSPPYTHLPMVSFLPEKRSWLCGFSSVPLSFPAQVPLAASLDCWHSLHQGHPCSWFSQSLGMTHCNQTNLSKMPIWSCHSPIYNPLSSVEKGANFPMNFLQFFIF